MAPALTPSTPPDFIIGNRYRILHRIGIGGMGTVYAAQDRLTGQTVALKRVTAPSDKLIFASRDATAADPRLSLAHEFRMLASLRHPNIISVLDYGFDNDRQPYFTMDLVEAPATIIEAAREAPTATRVELIVQVLQALSYLHRRGILHRDLKPGNILVRNHHARVLDFGLSVARSQAEQTTSGTLAYMAPEILQGQPATEASDLYALGMIMYELFNGGYPFELRSLSQLINQIVQEIPAIESLQIDPRLGTVLKRLLSKTPSERFDSASAVITALRATSTATIQLETEETRESFLQAAQFVGRDREVEQLTKALGQALRGHGSTWLIGGESGVGKSRLMDEMRARALIEGAAVLRGQTTREGRASYQLFREALRRLILLVDLTDLEASTLKLVVPDIGVLLERDVADALDLDPQAAQTRLLSTVTALVQRVQSPVVFMLEDLQWAGEDSLTLLTSLMRLAPAQPLLIIANFRDDERPELPTRLPTAAQIRLERLSSESIAALSESMLGAGGRQPEVVSLLKRETEGNVFFLVEIVRALAEEVGGLEQVGYATLPKHILTGGIQRIVERRLDRAPLFAQPLLRMAAVQGRQIDLDVLHKIDPLINIQSWLSACAESQILIVQEGIWRFAHDKLREGLIARLDDAQSMSVHRAVAQAIESVYRDVPEQFAALAFHWHIAGDAAKEQYYAALAGEQLLHTGVYREAIKLLERAAVLSDNAPVVSARLERLIAQAFLGLGRLPETDDHLKRAAGKLGAPLPVGGLPMLGQILIQAKHRLLWTRHVSTVEHERTLEIVRMYEQFALRYYWDNQKFPAFHAAIAMLNYAERIPPSRELIRAYANTVVAAGVVPAHAIARTYVRLVHKTGRKIAHPPSLATALRLIQVYFVGAADWEHEAAAYQEAIEIATRYGDFRVEGDTNAIHMVVLIARGAFAQSRAMNQRVYELGERTGSIQLKAWALANRGVCALYQGEPERALAHFLAGMALYEHEKMDEAQRLEYFGPLALAHLRSGDIIKAQQAGDQALDLMTRTAPVTSSATDGYACTAELFCTLWEQYPQETERYSAKAQQAVRNCFRYARIFPIGMARAYLWRGQTEILASNLNAAQKSWQTGLTHATRLHNSLDEAMIQYRLARSLPNDSAEREALLNKALATFERLDAGYYVRLIEQA